jgi:hypothetical protein
LRSASRWGALAGGLVGGVGGEEGLDGECGWDGVEEGRGVGEERAELGAAEGGRDGVAREGGCE